MAEKRTSAPSDEAAATVPRARGADDDPEPDQAPPAAQPDKAAKATRKAAKKVAKKAADPPRKAAGKAAKKTTAKKAPAKKAGTDSTAADSTGADSTGADSTGADSTGADSTGADSTAADRAPVAAPVPPVPVPEAAARPALQPEEWAAAAWDALRRPDQPPQRLAELAVAELGPRAAAWARWLRTTYPGAPADGMFRLATRQATRTGRVLALAGVAGPAAGPVCVPAAGWVRATVVLRVAAVYGQDPTDPDRAGELLELLGAGAETGARPGTGAGEPLDQVMKYARRLRVVRFIPGRVRWRRNPPLSLLGLFASISQATDDLERLAHRAARFYRAHPGGRAQPGSASRIDSSAESTSS